MKPRLAPLLALGAVGIFGAGACAVGPDFVRPKAPETERYTPGDEPLKTVHADGRSQELDPELAMPEKWWQLFGSPALDATVEQALAGSLRLQAALATLKQSESTLRAGYGVYYPSIDANAEASRQKSNPRAAGVNAPSSIFNLFTLSGTVSYALDVFGGARRAAEGLEAGVEFQRYTGLAAYLALTGNVVNAVIARAAYQAEIDATDSIRRAQKEQVDLLRAQVRAGTTAFSGVLSLEAQLHATEASLAPLRVKRDQADHLLSTLAGRAPSEWSAPPVALADLAVPEKLPRSLPSRLVRQRPDILSSEALLHESSAQIGVATAALYPSFTLSASYGQTNSVPGGLFGSNRNFWDFGAGITAPIFHGGTLRSQKQAAEEAYQAALANYRQTVLDAFAQVADTLRAIEQDALGLDAQARAMNASGEALKLTRANYRAGVSDYLAILTANSQFLQSRVAYFQGAAQRLQDTVALLIALGGGWWNATPGEQESGALGVLVPSPKPEPSQAP